MGESCRSAEDSCAIGSVAGDDLGREPGEDGNVDGDLVEEDAEAAANGGAVVARGGKDKTYAGRNIEGISGEAVVVEAHTEVKGQPGMDLPVVLHEESDIALCGLRGERGPIADAAAQGAVLTQDLNGEVHHLPFVGGVCVGVAKGQQMPACMFDWPEVKRLRPLVELRVALQLFEIAAGVLLRGKNHLSCQRGGVDVGVELLGPEQVLEEAAVGQKPAMSGGNEVVTQTIVGSD
jgi:hypothetical protein